MKCLKLSENLFNLKGEDRMGKGPYLVNEALDLLAERIMSICVDYKSKILTESEILANIEMIRDDVNDTHNLSDIMGRQGVEYIENFLIDHR